MTFSHINVHTHTHQDAYKIIFHVRLKRKILTYIPFSFSTYITHNSFLLQFDVYFHSKKHVKYINQIILSNKDNWILLENLVKFLVSKKCTKPRQATINSKWKWYKKRAQARETRLLQLLLQENQPRKSLFISLILNIHTCYTFLLS